MSDEEEYEYGMLDDGFTGVFEEEDLRGSLQEGTDFLGIGV